MYINNQINIIGILKKIQKIQWYKLLKTSLTSRQCPGAVKKTSCEKFSQIPSKKQRNLQGAFGFQFQFLNLDNVFWQENDNA